MPYLVTLFAFYNKFIRDYRENNQEIIDFFLYFLKMYYLCTQR